jgi:hypothetical protein
MLHHRGTIKRLRQIRPSRAHKQMALAEAEPLVEEAMAAKVPTAARPAPGRATPAKRAGRKGSARNLSKKGTGAVF